MLQALVWVEESGLARVLRQSGNLYMVVNATHILGIGLLIGAILPLDLRMLGVLRAGPVQVLGPFLSRVAAAGLGIAIVTGIALWSVRATEYLGNVAFQSKLLLVALGLANVGLQHRGNGWSRAIKTGEVPWTARLFAAFSLSIWLFTLLAGRWIGFL